MCPTFTVQTQHTKDILSIFTTPTFPVPLHCIVLLSMCDVADACSLQQKMLFSSSFPGCGAGCQLKIFLTHFCCPVTSPALSCYMCKLATEFGAEQPLMWCTSAVWDNIANALLQCSICDRTVNNRPVALCAYSSQQQHKSQCRWNWEVTCLSNDKLSMFHWSMKKWWWQLGGT